jgi:hypothetical protein
MDMFSCAQEKDVFKKFLMQLIISKSVKEDSFFDLDQVKEFDQIEINYIPILNIPFQNAHYDGVKIIFRKLFPKSSGLHNKTLVFIFPYTGGTFVTKNGNISRLMISLGCKSLTKNYLSIRNTLERLAAGNRVESFEVKSTEKSKYMNISTPMMYDMANGRLVYRNGLVQIS